MAPVAAVAASGLPALLAHPERIGVAYRPVADLRGGVVRGYATVAQLPAAGAAQAWFAVAEEAGSAGVLEAQVVQSALVVRPLLTGRRLVRVALSAAALLSEPVWSALAAEPSLDHLVVELDGCSAPCGALPTALGELRARGARVSVDLTTCGVDGLDAVGTLGAQSVVADARTVDLGALFAGLAELALEHEPRVVATGIDDDATLDAALRGGVRFGEGDALGRAVAMPGELSRAVRARLLRETPDLDLGGLAVPGPVPGPGTLALPSGTTLREAARRAMARPAALRFDPIAVVDEAGAPVGVVPVDRLVAALAG